MRSLLVLTASMSSQNGTAAASFCIDGVTTVGGEGATCHTLDNTQEWLVVTVTGYRLQSVNKVVVYNRIDCCQDRINNANLIYSYDFAGTSIIHQSSLGISGSLVYTFDFSTTTYVRIQHTTIINLVEVEMYYNNVKIPTGSDANIYFHSSLTSFPSLLISL